MYVCVSYVYVMCVYICANTDAKALLARRARNNRAEAVLLRVCVYIYVCVYMLCICYALADARYSIYLLY
jgi:TRAP-type mannitol/chloroaromatic compound transport system permease small subunit